MIGMESWRPRLTGALADVTVGRFMADGNGAGPPDSRPDPPFLDRAGREKRWQMAARAGRPQSLGEED